MYKNNENINFLLKYYNKNCIVSFSGGQDSISLLILLVNLKKRNNFLRKYSIFWCNHLWKKEDFYLLRHCLQLNFFFNNRFFYTIFFSKQYYEQKARKNRLNIIYRIANYSKIKHILTAHTKNDNIETFFLNLFRGSGKFGLHKIKNSQILLKFDCSQKFH